MYLKHNAPKSRLRDAENARRNRAEIVKALSTGQVTRRELLKMGIFTGAGLLLPISGLNPFVGTARADGVPTGTPPSPMLAGSKPFVQPLLRMHSLTRHPLKSTGGTDAQLQWMDIAGEPNAMRRSNTETIQHTVNLATLDNKGNVSVNGTTGPREGRPPGEAFAHQRWNELVNSAPGLDGEVSHPLPPVGIQMTIGQIAPGVSYNFANNWPAQNPENVWTFAEGKFVRGNFPPCLLQARYGESVINRIHNNLPFFDPGFHDPGFDGFPTSSAFPAPNITNGGFGRQEPAIHNHNGHNGAESDGAQNAHFFPGQYYDYHYSLMLARRDAGLRDSIGRDLDTLLGVKRGDLRCSTPTDKGDIIPIPGDFREIQSTLWFHDHRIDFTSQNVYKGYAALLEYFSGTDRGYERPGLKRNANKVNLRLPSGWRNNKTWGNRDFDVYLAIQDVAFDQNGQLFFDIFDTDGFLGDTIHVNYQWKPTFQVLPRKYRIRTLSAGMSRWIQLGVADSLDPAVAKFVPITIIANDGNIFPNFVRNANFMDFQGTGERYDFVIDFSQAAKNLDSQVGKKYYLVNLAQFSNGRKPDGTLSLQAALTGNTGDPCVGAIMEFEVVSSVPSIDDPTAVNTIKNACGKNDMSLINDPGSDWQIPIVDPVRTRTIEFVREGDGAGLPFDHPDTPAPWGIKVNGGFAHLADMKRSSNIPYPGDIENWTIDAGGGWGHPVHLHFEEARTLSRTTGISAMEFLKRKDVWHVGSVGDVTFQVTFGEFGGAYVNHCHNTVHEDNAMLLRYDLMKGNSNAGIDDVHITILPTPDPRPEGVTYVKTCYLPEGNPQGFSTGVDVCTEPSTGPVVPSTDPRTL